MSEEAKKLWKERDYANYAKGYSNALIDVLRTFYGIQEDLKFHKIKQNANTFIDIAKCMVDNRDIFRNNDDAFVRCKKEGGFEVWREAWNTEIG